MGATRVHHAAGAHGSAGRAAGAVSSGMSRFGVRGNAGRPTVLADAKPSEGIGAFAAKGRASRLVGKHMVGGLRKAVRRVRQAGSAGVGWMGGTGADQAAADDDFASKLGDGTRDLAFRAARAGVRGVTSSAAFIWRHRRAPVKAARAAKAAGQGGVRAVRAVANFVRMVVSRVMAGAVAVSLPILPVIAAALAVVGAIMAVLAFFLGSSASASTGVANVPAEYEADVIRAGSICQVVTPSVVAAQIDRESGWNPKAVSSAGAQGIAQFMPSTWEAAGRDGDGDGTADVWDAHDAIWSQGNYMCGLAKQVEAAKGSGRLTGDTLQLTLAAYNAGIGSVLKYGTVPPFAQTTDYVRGIVELSRGRYAAVGGGDPGATAGTLGPRLVMGGDGYHVDTSAMGIPALSNSYEVYQCTWWAFMRRQSMGKPVDAHMGDGAQWNDTAVRLGYRVSGSPKPGDVMCLEPGVLGSDGRYGHVAVVERVNPDGSILVSQSGRGWMSVVTQTISAAQLRDNSGAVSFIH